MTMIAGVANGIRGALLLARGQPRGVYLVENNHAAAAHSQWSIALSLPAVVSMKLLGWIGGLPANAPLALGRYLLLFVIGWLLFVWASHALAERLNLAGRWPRFIALWSYCSVVENTLFALGVLPGALGVPSVIAEACELVTLGWALWLDWYAVRVGLDVSPLAAVGLVLVDVGIGIAMGMLTSLSG